MIKLLIIADDFTGALDTGVQFAEIGINTLVTTVSDFQLKGVSEDIEVLVIDTESRYLSSIDAYNRVKKIILDVKRSGISYIYKKVDSALRGNVSSEIKGILDATGRTSIPFLPAYPEMNRILVNGNLYIEGVLVSESTFADDPYEPVKESNLLDRLKKEVDISSQLIQGDDIKDGNQDLLLFDSETDEDLKRQATLLEKKNLLGITIGCAGFAKALGEKIFKKKEIRNYHLEKPLTVISGSVNEITKRQIEYVEGRNFPRISLNIEQLLVPNYWKSSKGQSDIKKYLSFISKESLVVFETISEKTTLDIKQKMIQQNDYRFTIGNSLGTLTKELWSRHTQGTFLFIGGDTLFQTMKVLGIHKIKPLIQISAGVVLSEVEWEKKTIQVITKSGGFGHPELFEDIIQMTIL